MPLGRLDSLYARGKGTPAYACREMVHTMARRRHGGWEVATEHREKKLWLILSNRMYYAHGL